MVLRLKTRESRSLPGLQNATYVKQSSQNKLYGPKPRQKGRSRAAFCVKMHKQENTRQIAKAICSGSKRKPPKAFYATATNPNGICAGRGVEQPGSSSGS